MTTQLQNKLDYSIHLLQNAVDLAKLYDPKDGFFLAFSGGKDSQALYHVAKLAGVPFKAHMSLTSVDPPEVIRFVKTYYPDVELIRPKESICKVALHKQILPTSVARWCCDVYKEHTGAGKVTLTGVRRQESVKRSKRNEYETSRKRFSGTEGEFKEWQKEQIEKKDKYNLDTESQIRCISGKDSIIINPILHWTDKEVWEFLNNVVKVTHCKLYDQGRNRIGCLFCPLANRKAIYRDEKEYPHQRHKWIETIKAMRRKGYLYILDTYVDMSKYSEDEQAEILFDWWKSKQNAKDYCMNKFRQLKIDFEL